MDRDASGRRGHARALRVDPRRRSRRGQRERRRRRARRGDVSGDGVLLGRLRGRQRAAPPESASPRTWRSRAASRGRPRTLCNDGHDGGRRALAHVVRPGRGAPLHRDALEERATARGGERHPLRSTTRATASCSACRTPGSRAASSVECGEGLACEGYAVGTDGVCKPAPKVGEALHQPAVRVDPERARRRAAPPGLRDRRLVRRQSTCQPRSGAGKACAASSELHGGALVRPGALRAAGCRRRGLLRDGRVRDGRLVQPPGRRALGSLRGEAGGRRRLPRHRRVPRAMRSAEAPRRGRRGGRQVHRGVRLGVSEGRGEPDEHGNGHGGEDEDEDAEHHQRAPQAAASTCTEEGACTRT